MTAAFWFWIFYIALLLSGFGWGYRSRAWFSGFYWGWNVSMVCLVILLAFIGYHDFGPPFASLVR